MELLQVCAKHKIALLADEVYQDNVWAEGAKFTSFRKAAHNAGLLDALPLLSMHSTSKGFFGECGHRGGSLEALNVPEAVLTQACSLPGAEQT